jgi:hypothetical protein
MVLIRMQVVIAGAWGPSGGARDTVEEVYMDHDSARPQQTRQRKGRSMRYDVVVLGAGSGLRGRHPRRAAGLSVAIVEANLLGGVC